ncbi:MAG TPA: hypothetical protein PLW65_11175 [Pseudomonadota bacterium]|nr:hypothetical protein [Pseudomonadota bacterium]
MSSTSRISRRDLRQLIQKLLWTGSAQEVFVRQHFHDVFQLFTPGMDRTQQINLLFAHYEPDQILQALQQQYPEEVGPLLADLAPPEPGPGPT